MNPFAIKAAIAAAVLASLAGFACLQTQRLARAHAEVAVLTNSLKAANTAAKAAKAASAERASIIQRLTAEKEVTDAKLQAALDAAPDWASAPVPAAVLDSVR